LGERRVCIEGRRVGEGGGGEGGSVRLGEKDNRSGGEVVRV